MTLGTSYYGWYGLATYLALVTGAQALDTSPSMARLPTWHLLLAPEHLLLALLGPGYLLGTCY